MGIRVVITGSSGMVGKGVLLECLDSAKVEAVLVVNRSSIHLEHPKLKEILVEDFFDLEGIKNDLSGYDTCFFCLGTSSAGKSEASYTKITYDLTMYFAQAFLEQNKESVFCYVSGTGTDSSEKGRMMWARVKGKTENALFKLSFRAAYMFRPGYIQPFRGIKSKTRLFNVIYFIFGPLYGILKHFPRAATNTINLGKAMINVADGGVGTNILGNREINQLSISN